MAVSIQETIITPAKNGLTVQLYISDKPRNDESAAMRLALTATIPHQQLLVQRAALADISRVNRPSLNVRTIDFQAQNLLNGKQYTAS